MPKNYVSNDSSSSFDETPRCEISVEAASLAEPAMPKEIKRGTPLQKSLKHNQYCLSFWFIFRQLKEVGMGESVKKLSGELVDCYTKLMRQ